MSGQWEHDDDEARWELVAYREDVPRMVTERIVGAVVTDEMIARVAGPQMLAVRLFNRIGSVPPPLAEHLPPHDPDAVVYDLEKPVTAFACPCCGAVSQHPQDVAHGYCGRCHWWTGDPGLGPARLADECEARTTVRGG